MGDVAPIRKRVCRVCVCSVLAVFLLIGIVLWNFSSERGNVQTAAFESRVVSGSRKIAVYLPPGYTEEIRYPVLYLLHGADGDETAWQRQGSVDVVLDKLHRGNHIVPMIVVMPDTQGRGSVLDADLLQDVIPYVESHYAVRANRESRAIAGPSMGGGQAILCALRHPETFGWIGAFSPSLFGKNVSDLSADVDQLLTQRQQPELIWISCGNSDDRVMDVSKSLHELLKDKGIPHIWHQSSGGHEWRVWKEHLCEFVKLLFRDQLSG